MAHCSPARIISNLQYKDIWQEISGSLGDLGTFVPIAVALTLVNGLDLGTSLIATGIYNIFTGLFFGVPMPVQPMKSIAAVAITEENPLTVPQIMAAGLCVSGIVFVLGVTRLIWVIDRLIPLPVVRGIQLSQGLSFATTAVKYVMKNQDFAKGKAQGPRPWLGFDGILLATAVLVFIVVTNGSGTEMRDPCANVCPEENMRTADSNSRTGRTLTLQTRLFLLPTALLVFLLGIILAFVRDPTVFKALQIGPAIPKLTFISGHDWIVGFTRGSIPQLPLTILNSVVAVTKLSRDLYPSKDWVNSVQVSVSVGLMNLTGCWIGAMPVCHGAGGLAGQYRFGARSGLSVLILGIAKLILGLLFGSSLVKLLNQYPIGLLGVLLLFSGIELAMACRDQNSRLDSFVMLTCVAVSQASNLALGCICALILYVFLKVREVGLPALYQRLQDCLHLSSHEQNGYTECPADP